jgi:signal transduction histidine kinase
VNKKRSIFIIDKDNIIIFYNGDLHEVSSLAFDSEKIIAQKLQTLFDPEIILKLSSGNNSGYFDFKENNYIFKRKQIITPMNETLFYLEIEGESDENISFYSMLIHEIKNPLAAIRTLVQALSNHILGDLQKVSADSFVTAKDYFSRLTSEIDRLNRLLTSVKYIAKHIPSLYISFDIIKVANNTIKIFENSIKDKDIKIKTSFPHEPLVIYGDSDQFHQIFNNLITNAIEAIGDSKGLIQFTIFAGNDRSINIEVKDEGVGIDKNDLGNIFKAFYTKKIGGMGIGLTVVKMIVKHYKGTLDIESNLGQGTKVAISLPYLDKIESLA